MERRLHLFLPLALIAAGVLWILVEMGQIPISNLWALTYVWPVALIAAGLSLILRPYWRYAGALMSVLVVGGLFLAVLFAGELGWNRVPSYSINGVSFFGGTVTRGSGHVITQTRDVKGFNTIHIDYPASVFIQQGPTESLTIQAEDNVVAAMSTAVTNGTLEINSTRAHEVFINPTVPVNVTITVKDLTEVSFDSAGDLTVNGLKTGSFRAVLNGAGNMAFKKLQLGSFEAVLSGAGSLQADGITDSLNVRLDGLGSFNGGALHSQKAVVNVDGLGSATVWVDSNLKADVSGMGSVNYYGNPQVTKSVDGVGTVHNLGTK